MKNIFFLFAIFCFSTINAQDQSNRKTITTTRISETPKIDGNLDDDAWKDAEIATDFVELRPTNGKAASEDYKTEVKVVYDDTAIYISAMMLDPEPSKIPMQFSTRDNLNQADFFLITINPNDDGQNAFEFIVETTGNQADAKVSNGNEDFNWNAVWDSDAKVTDKGWSVEMKIPYRALRFVNKPVQSWGFNFHRKLRNINAQHTWSHIDNSSGATWTQFDGLVENFKNLKPPTRLSFYPYASISTDTYDGVTENDWSVGMDVKYGLSENFTLDATLIPDFSQAGFDNVTLNLGPFEQQYSEQRQFFTEGTDLFTKGRLFYSRRIGGRPIGTLEDIDDDNEEYTDYPGKVTMLNAVKISGRTKSGLGIGFFNAITEETKATVNNINTNEKREVIVNPFSNYNILVLDQQFNKNSAVTLINTNVWRDGDFRDANITGLLYHVETKDSKYNIDGSVKMSNLHDVIDAKTGYTFDTSIGKNSGNWRGEIGYSFEDKNYNPNDLGILFSNNDQTIYGNVSYRILKPKGIFNNYTLQTWFNVNSLHKPGTYTGTSNGLSFWATTTKRFGFGANLNYRTKTKDFNEPRQGNTSGTYFERPQRLNTNAWISSDYRKKFAYDINAYKTSYTESSKSSYGFGLSPRYRFSDKFSLVYNFDIGKTENDQGYVGEESSNIIFGERDRKNLTNTLSGKYNFSIKSSVSLSFRHNWSTVTYQDKYYNLNTNGSLSPTTYTKDDINYNNWNLDVNYKWEFAPGSQLIALYRNSIFNEDTNSQLNFTDNIENLFNQDKGHTFSLRLVYFIDYNNLKKIFS